MKKRIALMLAGLLLCSAFAGCGRPDATAAQTTAALCRPGGYSRPPCKLSDEQYRALSLANIHMQEFIAYEYQADENLRCITTAKARYIPTMRSNGNPPTGAPRDVTARRPLSNRRHRAERQGQRTGLYLCAARKRRQQQRLYFRSPSFAGKGRGWRACDRRRRAAGGRTHHLRRGNPAAGAHFPRQKRAVCL